MVFERDTADLLRRGRWQSAQTRASRGLRHYPASAQLWVFLGESLEQQGKRDAAWAAYERGWMLDPAASWLPDVKKRLSGVSDRVTDEIEALLQVPNVTVTAAIIARNESETINEVIASLRPAVDEVLVIDTGSTDETATIAEEAGARVKHFSWTDDFSAARNYALDNVQTDWVLWVDADEVLDSEDIEVPRKVAALFDLEDPPVVLRVVQMNKVGDHVEPNFDSSRMFKMGRGFRWSGRIHEQIIIDPEKSRMSLFRPSVRIRLNHSGYDPEVVRRKGKYERNIRLLRQSVEESPEDVVMWGFLGRDLFFAGKLDEAISALQTAENMAKNHPLYGRLPEVRQALAEALWRVGRIDEALQVMVRQTSDSPTFPGGWYLLGQLKLAKAVALMEEATGYFQRSLDNAPMYRGVVSFDQQISVWKATVGLADAAKLKGRWDQALPLYERALSGSPNNPAIKQQINYLESQSQWVIRHKGK